MTKASILIPTFNQERYLSQAIESALAQDYEDLEVIVVDDASTDGTSNVVMAYQGKPGFQYFRNKCNLGRVANYRHGLYDCATGDYILSLDGDDWLTDTQYIRKAAEILDNNPDVGFVAACTCVYQEKDGSYVNCTVHKIDGIIDGTEYIDHVFSGKAVFRHLAAVFRREEAIRSNFYTVDSIATDGISFFMFACHTKVALVPRIVGIWRIHNDTESKRFYWHAVPEDLFLLEETVGKQCDQITTSWINSRIYDNSYSYLAWAVKVREFRRISELLQYLNIKYPGFLKRNGFRLFRDLLSGAFLFVPLRIWAVVKQVKGSI